MFPTKEADPPGLTLFITRYGAGAHVMATRQPQRRLGWRDLASRTPQGSILMVEDELTVRNGLVRLLTEFGHDVSVASSAEEADHCLTSGKFDLMLLDIDLPRMNGIELLVWALKRDPELAVIMLTGLDRPDLALKCFEAGARTYLVKPIASEFLRPAVRDALALRQLLVERNNH